MKPKLLALGAAVAFAAFTQYAQAADPIKIGMLNEITGPNAEAGVLQANGANMAVAEINKAGGLLGRPIEVVVEDTQSTNPGSVLAISKLTSRGDITALITTVRSTQVQAVEPTIRKAALPAVFGGTDVALTHMGDPWMFRIRPNDGYSSKVLAEYGVKVLGLKKWAIVHSADAFGNGGRDALIESLKALGVTPVMTQGFPSNSQDLTSVVLAVRQSGADIVSTYIANSPDVGIFGKQLRQLGVKADWVGSSSMSTDTAIKLASGALNNTYSIADFAIDSGPDAQAYAKRYQEAYKSVPDMYSAWTYDAVSVLAQAIKKANSTKPDDIRKALHEIRDFHGAEGVYNYDQNGDGQHGYYIVKNDNGKIVFIKSFDFFSK
jgi:branched-chain amino acid transport system substrate-binding protein